MAEPVITRDEVVALPFNVSDIAVAATNINRFLPRDDEDGEELTKAEREELDAFIEQALKNAQRTREPAGKAQAELDAKRAAED